MAAFAFMADRNGITYALVSTVAIGLISTLAVWGNRHATDARSRTRRVKRQATEMECRYMVASWMNDPDDPVWVLFSSKDNARGTTARGDR